MAGQARSRASWWFQERSSPDPWKQDGLDHVRQLMPQSDPFRAWATFSFTAPTGCVSEGDPLIAIHMGLHVVERKGHPGCLINNRDTCAQVDEVQEPKDYARGDNSDGLPWISASQVHSNLLGEVVIREEDLTGWRPPASTMVDVRLRFDVVG